MPSRETMEFEILSAVAGSGAAWSVTVTKLKTVQSAAIIPLGAGAGGTSASLNQAGSVTSTDGQTINFNNDAAGASQPATLTVLALYTGT